MQSQKIKCNVATCLPPAAPEPRRGPGCLPLPRHLTPRALRAEQHEKPEISATTSSLVNHKRHRTLPSTPLAGSLPLPTGTNKLPSFPARPVRPEIGFSALPASILSFAGREAGLHAHLMGTGPSRQLLPALPQPPAQPCLPWPGADPTLLLWEAQPLPAPAEGISLLSSQSLSSKLSLKCWKKPKQTTHPRLTRSSWCLEFSSKRKKEASAKGQ